MSPSLSGSSSLIPGIDCNSGTSGIRYLIVIGTVVCSLQDISSSDGQNPLCNGVYLNASKAR